MIDRGVCGGLRRVGLGVAGGVLANWAVAGATAAQTVAPTPPEAARPENGTQTGPAPNAITPPGGIARGVIPPPRSVDPEMVTPPAAMPTMPIIKPPGTSR